MPWNAFDANIMPGEEMLRRDFVAFIELVNSNTVRCRHLDNLKKNKQAAGRTQDLADLENLK